MKKMTLVILAMVGLSLGLAGCRLGRNAVEALPTQNAQPAAQATLLPVATLTSELATPTNAALSAATPTPGAENASAEGAAEQYLQLLAQGDWQQAAQMFSDFSLLAQGLTRGEAAAALHKTMQDGAVWSAGEVVESREFDAQTTLVHVRYSLQGAPQKDASPRSLETPGPYFPAGMQATPAATAADGAQSGAQTVDEWWPLRHEAAGWRYNRENLIDTLTLDVKEQSMNGLTIKPLQLARYSDHLNLVVLVQNHSDGPITLGQANETLAAFTFGDMLVEADPAQWTFQRLHSYTGVYFSVQGFYSDLPERVVIRQWKNLQVPPWFQFELTQ